MIRYQVHGLGIESDMVLPPLVCLPGDPFGDHPVSVRILQGALPGSLENAEVARRLYQSTPGEALMHAPGVGRIHVIAGNRIVYELASAARKAELAAHILGSGFAILHQQRGNTVLHASSMVRDGAAFLLCGMSGSGKSTSAAHLFASGASTLGDDVCLVGGGPDFLVHPGVPSTKLAADALEALPEFAERPQQGTCPSGKAIIGTLGMFSPEPVPLAGIFMLATDHGAAEVTARRLDVAEGMAALRQNTFRKRCITRDCAAMLLPKWCTLSKAVPIWRIGRPSGQDTRQQVVQIIDRLSKGTAARQAA